MIYILHMTVGQTKIESVSLCLPFMFVCLFIHFYPLLTDCPRWSSMCRTMTSPCYDLRMVICIFVSMFSWYCITRKTGSRCFIKSTALLLESYFPVVIARVASLSLLKLFVYGIFFVAFDCNCASLNHLNTFLHGVQENFFFSLEHLNPLSHEWANARAKKSVSCTAPGITVLPYLSHLKFTVLHSCIVRLSFYDFKLWSILILL